MNVVVPTGAAGCVVVTGPAVDGAVGFGVLDPPAKDAVAPTLTKAIAINVV